MIIKTLKMLYNVKNNSDPNVVDKIRLATATGHDAAVRNITIQIFNARQICKCFLFSLTA